jgi:hypothetical protein
MTAIVTLVLIRFWTAFLAHSITPRWGPASFVGGVVGLALTKLAQHVYYGHLGSMWLLSLPGELAVALGVAYAVGWVFVVERGRSKQGER